MERKFDGELRELNQKILKMASMAEDSIVKSIEALSKRNEVLANEVIDFDKKIDELELLIDEKTLDLLALRQPMAVDLRFITMGMKITTNLERIADLSVDIAQRALEVINKPLIKPLVDIPKLAQLSQKMVRDSIEAFVNRDTELAKKVCLSDDEADRLRDLVQDELINDYIVKDGTSASRAVPLLLVARHLERICDHATNIAENVIYLVEAKVVKHHKERLA